MFVFVFADACCLHKHACTCFVCMCRCITYMCICMCVCVHTMCICVNVCTYYALCVFMCICVILRALYNFILSNTLMSFFKEIWTIMISGYVSSCVSMLYVSWCFISSVHLVFMQKCYEIFRLRSLSSSFLYICKVFWKIVISS